MIKPLSGDSVKIFILSSASSDIFSGCMSMQNDWCAPRPTLPLSWWSCRPSLSGMFNDHYTCVRRQFPLQLQSLTRGYQFPLFTATALWFLSDWGILPWTDGISAPENIFFKVIEKSLADFKVGFLIPRSGAERIPGVLIYVVFHRIVNAPEARIRKRNCFLERFRGFSPDVWNIKVSIKVIGDLGMVEIIKEGWRTALAAQFPSVPPKPVLLINDNISGLWILFPTGSVRVFLWQG